MATISTAVPCEDDLIKAALAGDAESFAVLLDRHIVSIRKSVLFMVRNLSDAEDIVQDALFKIWSRLSTFRSESTFRTWATRVAINETMMLHRRERNRRSVGPVEDLDQLASPCELTDKILIRTEEEREVRRAVGRLPPTYRSVVILHDFEQLSVKETAHRLQISIPAAKSRLFRARHMLSVAIRNSRLSCLTPAA